MACKSHMQESFLFLSLYASLDPPSPSLSITDNEPTQSSPSQQYTSMPSPCSGFQFEGVQLMVFESGGRGFILHDKFRWQNRFHSKPFQQQWLTLLMKYRQICTFAKKKKEADPNVNRTSYLWVCDSMTNNMTISGTIIFSFIKRSIISAWRLYR
jgi:hypothetical protein